MAGKHIIFDYPPIAKNRGPRFWCNPTNIWAARRKLRIDHSNSWRSAFHRENPVPPAHSVAVSSLLSPPDASTARAPAPYRFVVLGDSGEGGKMQYGLLPLIRALAPDFMIVNGDVAYPAGDSDDFVEGFFEPYRNLGIPIWATPGNHEYYSSGRGREFYETFCTWTWATRWSTYGLRLIPQPGMYWEIADVDSKLVILGVDSGMKGRLDPKRQDVGDADQHAWLLDRLSTAGSRGDSVIVLFHIPKLVNGQPASEPQLTRLHETLRGSAAVKLVVCAHEHSLQIYAPNVFGDFLTESAPPSPGYRPPDYIVGGGSGAFIASTKWAMARQKYQCKAVEPANWPAYVWKMRRALKVIGLGASVLDRIVGAFNESVADEADVPDMMSFVLVAVDPGRAAVKGPSVPPRVTVTPVVQADFSTLFNHLPDGTRVNVQAGVPAPDQAAVQACLRTPLSIQW